MRERSEGQDLWPRRGLLRPRHLPSRHAPHSVRTHTLLPHAALAQLPRPLRSDPPPTHQHPPHLTPSPRAPLHRPSAHLDHRGVPELGGPQGPAAAAAAACALLACFGAVRPTSSDALATFLVRSSQKSREIQYNLGKSSHAYHCIDWTCKWGAGVGGPTLAIPQAGRPKSPWTRFYRSFKTTLRNPINPCATKTL